MTEKRAAAYVRVSTERQAKEGLSLDEQVRRVEAHIANQGWTLVDTFIEAGVSGRKDDRPELRRLLEAVDRGDFDIVVIPKLDRFGRSVRQLHENFARLDRANVGLVSLTESIDTSTSVGRLLRAVLAALAEFESDTIGDRVASVTAARAASGKAHGRAPYGYRPAGKDGILIDPAEAAIVKRIFREYVAGTSQRQIARDLNRDGHRAQRDGPWVQGTVSKLLANPVYVGKVRLNGELYDGTHKAIITASTWRKAEQMRIAGTRSRRGRTPTANHVLAGGMLLCGRCGSTMNATTKPTRTPGVDYEVYTCSGRAQHGLKHCDQPPVKRKLVDTAIWRFFTKVALDIDATRTAITELNDARLSEIDALRSQADRDAQKTGHALVRIEADYVAGKISPEQWARLEGKLTSELAAAKAQVARLDTRRTAIVTEMEQIDTESEVLEQIAALRSIVIGEIRDSSRASVDSLRAALRRLFEPFALVSLVKHPDGRLEALGDKTDHRCGWYGYDHPDLWLQPETMADESSLRYVLTPVVRHDAVTSIPTAGDPFPALTKAALSLGGSDPNTLQR